MFSAQRLVMLVITAGLSHQPDGRDRLWTSSQSILEKLVTNLECGGLDAAFQTAKSTDHCCRLATHNKSKAASSRRTPKFPTHHRHTIDSPRRALIECSCRVRRPAFGAAARSYCRWCV